MEITGKTFLVTGGASGLGLATAEIITAHGGRVVVIDLNHSYGEAAAASLGSAARFFQADVADEKGIAQAIQLAIDTFGGLHGAVLCAGVGPAARILGKEAVHSLEAFEKVVHTNLTGTFNVMRLAAEAIQQSPAGLDGARGIIITTASVAAFDGQIGQAAYAASKGGVVALTLPAARELARFGIRVMCIAPGIFDTPLLKNLSQEVQESLSRQVPFPQRFGRPDEFAALVKHIIENDLLNGEVIRLDGGIRMGAGTGKS